MALHLSEGSFVLANDTDPEARFKQVWLFGVAFSLCTIVSAQKQALAAFPAALNANVLRVSHAHRLAECFRMLTDRSARLLNLRDYGITVGNPADLVVIRRPVTEQAVAEICQPLAVFIAGGVPRSGSRPALAASRERSYPGSMTRVAEADHRLLALKTIHDVLARAAAGRSWTAKPAGNMLIATARSQLATIPAMRGYGHAAPAKSFLSTLPSFRIGRLTISDCTMQDTLKLNPSPVPSGVWLELKVA